MPHLIIESSLSLPSATIKKLHMEVGNQETISLEALKTRFYRANESLVGDFSENRHTAITLKLLPGRSSQLKEKIADHLLEMAKSLIPNGTISVEVNELEIYKK